MYMERVFNDWVKRSEQKSEQERVNRIILLSYKILVVVLGIAYGLEVVKGSRTLQFYGIFVLVLIASYVITEIAYRKNPTDVKAAYVGYANYTLFYTFALFYLGIQESYIYILPIMVTLPLMHSYKFSTFLVAVEWLINIVYTIWSYNIDPSIATTKWVAAIEIQIAGMFLVGWNISTTARVDASLNKAKMDSIRIEKEKTDKLLQESTERNKEIEDAVSNISVRINSVNDSMSIVDSSMTQINDGNASSIKSIEESLKAVASIDKELTDLNKETGEYIEELKNTSEGMEKNDELLKGVIEKSQESSEIVGVMQENLKELTKNIKSSQDEIEEIAEIARRIRLISLNAQIEAANAGEYGRGFRVIADEIQKLSEQTEKVTKGINKSFVDIAKTMDDTQGSAKEVNNSFKQELKQIGEVRESFEEMNNQVKQSQVKFGLINDSHKQINNSKATVQATSETVAAVVEEITANTETTSEQVTKNVAELKGISEILDELKK